ncbi:MAG: hypothetical protein JRH19_19350 [Deltaproteobacteria bacterium]|nr:hypothetical protein [Deltaproteobacteria bacterium]
MQGPERERGSRSERRHFRPPDAGAALLYTSLVLGTGFFLFMFGYMFNFGLLSGLAALLPS